MLCTAIRECHTDIYRFDLVISFLSRRVLDQLIVLGEVIKIYYDKTVQII
jgi:hypothetical protein